MKGFFFLFIAALAGCTATKLTSSWTAPSAGSYNYQKILVVSLIRNEDSVLKRKMEEHLANDLKAVGYEALAYTTTFRPGELKQMRYDSIRSKLSALGIDGVITISLMAKEKERVYLQDRGQLRADNLPLGGFWQTPATVKQDAGKPGYYVTSTEYFWESNFYDVNSVALLYNARSTAFEVTSAESLAHKYGKLVVTDMQKAYLLTAKK